MVLLHELVMPPVMTDDFESYGASGWKNDENKNVRNKRYVKMKVTEG